MTNPQKILNYLFVSKVRIKCLKYFFTNPEAPIHLREMARQLNEEINAVRRELLRLSEIKLLKADTRGNKKYFSLNNKFPFFDELNSIFYKSTGIGEDIIKAQAKIGNIYFAALTNSYVNGLKMTNKDIEMVVVGDIEINVLNEIVHKYEQEQGREINYTVLRLVEFNLRKKRRDPFIINLLLNTKILLIGEREEYIL